MARARNRLVPVIQLGNSQGAMNAVANELDKFGEVGYELADISTFGNNNRFSFAGFVLSTYKWQYKLLQFSFKVPGLATEQLERLGAEGWELVTVYSQGANNMATAAVLKRPCGKVEIDTGAKVVKTESRAVTDTDEHDGEADQDENQTELVSAGSAAGPEPE